MTAQEQDAKGVEGFEMYLYMAQRMGWVDESAFPLINLRAVGVERELRQFIDLGSSDGFEKKFLECLAKMKDEKTPPYTYRELIELIVKHFPVEITEEMRAAQREFSADIEMIVIVVAIAVFDRAKLSRLVSWEILKDD